MDKIFTVYVKPGTIGVHGKDDQGNTWSTITYGGGHKEACDHCGKLIDGGYIRFTEPALLVCAEHVQYVSDEPPGTPPPPPPLPEPVWVGTENIKNLIANIYKARRERDLAENSQGEELNYHYWAGKYNGLVHAAALFKIKLPEDL